MSKKIENEEFEYVSDDDNDMVDKKINKIKKILKQCQKEKEEYLAGWQRAKADLINYKREQEQKISDYYKFANEGFISEILPVLDSFELALKHTKNKQDKEEISQLYNQLLNILKSNGLEEIKAVGEKFNPEIHEAIGEIKGEKGIVIEETQKGYFLNKKVVRPSKVKIGK